MAGDCQVDSKIVGVAKKMGKLEEAYLEIFKSKQPLDLGPTLDVRLRRHEIG